MALLTQATEEHPGCFFTCGLWHFLEISPFSFPEIFQEIQTIEIIFLLTAHQDSINCLYRNQVSELVSLLSLNLNILIDCYFLRIDSVKTAEVSGWN